MGQNFTFLQYMQRAGNILTLISITVHAIGVDNVFSKDHIR